MRVTTSWATALLSLAPLATSAALAQNIQVDWDPRGVPHVTAPTDEGVFFGQGYASAKNRIGQMHRARQAADGRLAELVGCATVGDGKSPGEFDREIIYLDLYHAAQGRLAKLDPATRSALQAYADGVNAYLDELQVELTQNPSAAPSLLPDILFPLQASIASGSFPRWSAVDSVACWEYVAYFFTNDPRADGDATNQPGSLPLAGPVDEEGCVLKVATEMPQWALGGAQQYQSFYYPNAYGCDPLGGPPTAQFSHGWAVSGAKSASGAAIVHNEPHLPVQSPCFWYESRLTHSATAGGFDARGITMIGCPGLFMGYNSQVAWGMTALGMDAVDVIELEPAVDSTKDYRYEGVDYAFIDGGTRDWCDRNGNVGTIDVKRTRFGPVVTGYLFGDAATPARDYVLRSNFNVDIERHSLQSAVRAPRSRSVEELRDTFRLWVTPALTSVFGDDTGKIGFQTLVGAPTRGDQRADAGRVAIAPGDDASLDWQRIVPLDFLPWSIRTTGELLIANNRPAGCWYPIPLNYQISSIGQTERSQRLDEIFKSVGAPTSWTQEDVARVSFDEFATFRRQMTEVLEHIVDDVLPGLASPPPYVNALIASEGELDGFLANGASSRLPGQNLPRYLQVALKLKARLGPAAWDPAPVGGPTFSVSGLLATYGSSTAGGLALLTDLDARDLATAPLAPTFDPVGNPTNFDAEVIVWIGRQAAAAVNAANNPNTTIQLQLPLPYFAGSALGGIVASLNVAHDLGYRVFDQDGMTLWSARSKSYVQNVDLADVSTARVLLPVGNEEDPDDADLGLAFANGALDVWRLGNPGSTSNVLPQMADGDFDTGPPVFSAALSYNPLVTYFGLDDSGRDPKTAVALTVAGAPTSIQPGDTVTIELRGVDSQTSATVAFLTIGSARVQAASTGTPLWTNGTNLFPMTIQGDLATITFTVPQNFTGNRIFLQGAYVDTFDIGFDSSQAMPFDPQVEIRATAGMELRIGMP